MPTSQAPTAVRFENASVSARVIGIGEAEPRISWVVPTADTGWLQTAYELELTRDGASRTYVVDGPEQILVPWPGDPLGSGDAAQVRVRVRGAAWSPWSEIYEVEAGVLREQDWVARFVSPVGVGELDRPAPVLRGTWRLPGGIVSARLYATAHGLFSASLNGASVGDDFLSPGWSSYHNRLRYESYDVTELLHPGENEVEVVLGNGWWRGALTWNMKTNYYGDRLAFLGQLEVRTETGERLTFTADETWTSAESNIVANDLYGGQTTDLTGTLVTRTGTVETVSEDTSTVVAPDGPPVRVTETVPATRIWRSPSGNLLVDFGQNLVGWVRLRAQPAPGAVVDVRHAEVLEADELGTRPLRNARATDRYLIGTQRDVTLEPQFTFHGFRYAQIDGVDEASIVSVEAVVLGSDMERTGYFESSDPLLDRLHENVVWGMRGNFVDVPTDCPQRDERLGWTGDIAVFAPTAQYLFNSTGLLRSWLKDLAADQYPDGGVPWVIPDVLNNDLTAAVWGDAAVVVPWTLYERSADKRVLEEQLPSMLAWVRYMANKAGSDGVWRGGFQFGDWLDPTAPPDDAMAAKADPDAVATAYFARSAQLLALAASVVGDGEVVAEANAVYERARRGFRREFVTPSGRVMSDAQTVYSLALVFGLLEGDERAHAAAKLADLVRLSGFTIATGFVGTPLISDALADNGYVDVAYRLLLQTACPSWLYPVTMGATTIWERWDSMLPDGTINPGEMTSFNHYALGAVADWLHRTVAGLAPTAPGYEQIRIAPQPGGGLTHAATRHTTPYGEATVAWRLQSEQLHVEATVPVGITATVSLPGRDSFDVGHGTYTWQTTITTTAVPSEIRTVRDLLDNPLAWQRFSDAALRLGVGGLGEGTPEAALAGRLAPVLNEPPHAALGVLAFGSLEGPAAALAAELDHILVP
ncbi:MAG: family 78 glycoside hydrolase catalytic domain [Cellulomonadaceae bacterium]|nr:family 78 glycoside hydrolase catalytic domain [Cellulomonadaceae bacterium]